MSFVLCLSYVTLCYSFIGESRNDALLAASDPMEDSGYETPSKRAKLPTSTVPPPPISELESGYETLYLCKKGSLQESYDLGLPPPRKNSPEKVVAALGLTSGCTRSVDAQIERVANYRNFGTTDYTIVDISQE